MKTYRLSIAQGMEMTVLDYGGIITHLLVPDSSGKLRDVVLGFDRPEKYREPNPYFGAIVGRYANRIANGTFQLDGQTVELPINNGQNNLHGGPLGFDRVMWDVEQINDSTLWLTYLSEDGENGFPGNLKCKITYHLSQRNELRIDYEAKTDKTTVVNLTNHSYFNLADGGTTSILDHKLSLNCRYYTPINEYQIPTGEVAPVAGTAFDFTEPRPIGERVDEIGNYDHNLVLEGKEGALRHCGRVSSGRSGIVMEVLTSEPGVQFFTPKELNILGKKGQFYGDWPAFCLETQHFPDSPNHPEFPSTVLHPEEKFKSTTIYRFGVGDATIY